MDSFIGREYELRFLEDLYSEDGMKTCSIYGRRQVGKSTLLSEFCKGKDSIIIQAIDSSSYENKVMMSNIISKLVLGETKTFDSFVEIMGLFEDYCRSKKTVLIFDEYPFLVKTSPEFASILQRFIDRQIKDTETMLIICGSSISSMCDETQSYDRPLYGRMRRFLEVKELGFESCSEFHKKMNPIDILKTYLVLGGVPKYHSLYDEKSFSDVIKKHFISDKDGIRQEAQSMITMELQSSVYVGIVACIANGSVAQYEIADKLRIDRGACKRYLDKLERIHIVEKMNPMFDSPSRPSYRIKDNYVAFYYEVIRKYEYAFGRNQPSDGIFTNITQDINSFIGHRFEDLCKKYIVSEYVVADIGSWWTRDGGKEIDIIAKVIGNDSKTSYVVSECKITKDPMTLGMFHKLEYTAEEINGLDNVKFVLFSVNGFDEKLKDHASINDIELVSLEELMNWPKTKRSI